MKFVDENELESHLKQIKNPKKTQLSSHRLQTNFANSFFIDLINKAYTANNKVNAKTSSKFTS